MRIGLLYPCVTALVEKTAAIFPEGIEVVGPRPDGYVTNDCVKRMPEWKGLRLNVVIDERPYEAIDFSVYDVLIESVEAFQYAVSWREHCRRIECPIIVKACWTEDPARTLPAEYVASRRQFPAIVEMPSHVEQWKTSPFEDVTWIPNAVGDWWFERPWTGEIEAALFVLAGANAWRPADRTVCGLDVLDRLKERFPGRIVHHDGFVDYKTASEMSEMFSRYRVFLNLDREGSRPLTTSFTEALAAGMPVVARDLGGLSYKRFIDGNGICTNDLNDMSDFIERCLEDRSFAEGCGHTSRIIAATQFSSEAVRPAYLAAIERARRAFDGGAWR